MVKSKNNKSISNEIVTKQYKIVTSFECEKCNTKCSAGINYLERCSKSVGKPLKGVVCKGK